MPTTDTETNSMRFIKEGYMLEGICSLFGRRASSASDASSRRVTSGSIAPLLPALVIVLVVGLAACDNQPADDADESSPQEASSQEADQIVIDDAGFATPESVLHDEEDDVYLVSNINGSPFEADDNGFISRLNAEDGEVIDLMWIDGADEDVTLHAPKGMAIVDDILYVSDVDGVRLFDRTSGDPIDHWEVDGNMLNDLCAGPEGTIYQTDTGLELDADGNFVPTGTDALYRFENGNPEAILQGESLMNPNGCITVESDIYVVPFGSNEVYRTDPSGEQSAVGTLPEGQLDGIVHAQGELYITSWGASSVYRMPLEGGTATEVLTDVAAPADLGYDAVRNRLLVPLFQDNALTIEPLDSN